MKLIGKYFHELTTRELFEIYKLRSDVFIIEQQCACRDVDEADLKAYHLWLQDEDGIAAYARVLPPGLTFPTGSIGRVIAVRRRCGLGTQIVNAAIAAAKEQFCVTTITIEAQTYARKLYENCGFVQCGEEFLEDGIPHIPMVVAPQASCDK